MEITKTEVNKNMLFGEIEGIGHKNKTYLLYAFDLANKFKHYFDEGKNFKPSLVIFINIKLKNDILERLGCKNVDVRCFIYEDEEINEYSFSKEENGFPIPFVSVPYDERQFLYKPFYERVKKQQGDHIKK